MGKSDTKFHDSKQNFPNELGKNDIPYQREAEEKGFRKDII